MKIRFFLSFMMITVLGSLCSYEKPRGIEEEVWKEALPFLFPETHPNYSFLKELFKKRRVTLSTDSLKKSGFSNIKLQPFTKMTTATHEKLPGLFFKIYLDAQKPYKRKPEYFHWLSRIKGANLIREVVEKKGWHPFFKIPKKWMFPIPAKPASSPLFEGVSFILIEEDMELLPFNENLQMWKSERITPEFLDHFHYILTHVGLSDCCTPKNSPFSVDERMCFIDTQTTMSFPVPVTLVPSYLSKEMSAYWKTISKEKKVKK